VSQPADHSSFRRLLPTFIISAGTQVVLKVTKRLAEGEELTLVSAASPPYAVQSTPFLFGQCFNYASDPMVVSTVTPASCSGSIPTRSPGARSSM
jgi:hypothetical protein